MHPLLLAGGAGLALLALSRKKAAPDTSAGAPGQAPTPAPAPSGGGGAPSPQQVLTAVAALVPVVATIGGSTTAAGAGGAAAAAASTGAATLGAGAGNVTLLSGGLAGGALIGGAVATTAAGVLVGSQLGKGTLFGEAGGGVIGGLNVFTAAPALAGAQVGRELHKLFGGDGFSFTPSNVVLQVGGATTLGLATVLGGAAIIGFAPLVLAVFGVVAAIEDANRLKRGQAGALEDWKADYNAAFKMFSAKLASLAPTATADAPIFASAAAWGWANTMNRQRWAAWNAKPRGIGVDANGHALYGIARGYWYQYPGANIGQPGLYEPPEVTNAKTMASQKGYGATFQNAMSAGNVAANVRNYQWAMAQPRGLGQSDAAHFDYWVKGGFFWGNRNEKGELVYDGKTWGWK
jgi:hypothetical protein